MKQSIISVLFFVFLSSIIVAQGYAVDKGGIIISGVGSFTSQGGDLFENSEGDRLSAISLSPALNYFIIPNFSIGGAIAYTSQSQGDNSLYSIGIGPTLGYFFGDANSNSYPYLSAGVRYNSIGNDDDSISGTDIVFGGGVIITVKDHIGIVIEAGYHIINLKHEDWKKSQSGDIISIGIGIAGLIF